MGAGPGWTGPARRASVCLAGRGGLGSVLSCPALDRWPHSTRPFQWVLTFEIFIPLVLFFILLGLRQKKPTISVKEGEVLGVGPGHICEGGVRQGRQSSLHHARMSCVHVTTRVCPSSHCPPPSRAVHVCVPPCGPLPCLLAGLEDVAGCGGWLVTTSD